MKKRSVCLFLAMTLVICLFAGCGMPGVGGSSGASTGGADSTGTSGGASSGDQITLRIVDWNDSTMEFREKFHEAYMADHPNIKIEYTMLTADQFKNTILTSVMSGDGPDIFPIPSGIYLPTVMEEEWYQAMEPYLTEEFIATLDPEGFIEGVTLVNGEIYTLPQLQPLISSCIYYNQDVLDAAGVTELPTTYDEFIAVCRQVTEAGNGQFYGFIEGGKQTGRLDNLVRAFAGMAGAKIAAPNKVLTVDGKAPYDSPELVSVYELFATLTRDGSIHPDTVNINAPEAREMFAQGQAAFLAQGMWCIAPWESSYPALNYGVMAIPTPDGIQRGAVQREEWSSYYGIYSQSEHPQEAADYLMAMYGEEYGYFAECVAAGERLSVIPSINEANTTNEIMRQYVEVSESMMRVVPSATLRDTQAYDFYTEVKDIQPNLASILQGVMAGSITDYEQELAAFTELSTTEWKRACEALGLDYGVFEFPNWDVTEDYTQEDYAALN